MREEEFRASGSWLEPFSDSTEGNNFLKKDKKEKESKKKKKIAEKLKKEKRIEIVFFDFLFEVLRHPLSHTHTLSHAHSNALTRTFYSLS